MASNSTSENIRIDLIKSDNNSLKILKSETSLPEESHSSDNAKTTGNQSEENLIKLKMDIIVFKYC